MHPRMMNEANQYPIQRNPRRQGLGGSKSKKHIQNSNEGPYLPSNPARRKDRSCHVSSRSFPKQNRLDRCRSRSPPLPTRNTPASVSLDNAVATPRQSRWESQSSSSLDKASATPMSMPTRRRGAASNRNNDLPSRPNRPTKPQEKQQFPSNTPRNSASSKSLKSIRRKLSGDLDANPPRRSSPVLRQKSPRSVILAESDEEDDHVYVRRTDSDSSLVFGGGDRRDDNDKRKDSTSRNRSKSRTGRRRPVPPQQQQRKASTIAISCTTHDDEDNTSTTMLLDDSLTNLMRSLDNSEDKGHIFLSARHLLSFASDSDTDGC